MDEKQSNNRSGQAEEVADYGLVSVIMPNYNGEKYLAEAIASVLAQSYKNLELIIADDCSSDKSLEIVKSFSDARIKVFRNEKNCGAACSHNAAIKKASGKWLAFLDGDDAWSENKLLLQLGFMQNEQIAFSFSDYYVKSENSKELIRYSPKKSEYDYKAILKHNAVGCSTVILNREALGEVYMPEEATLREDFACWLKILKTGVKAVRLPEPLTVYRVGGKSVSSNKLKMAKYQWSVYKNVEKIGFFASVYYTACWAINGIFKYKR